MNRRVGSSLFDCPPAGALPQAVRLGLPHVAISPLARATAHRSPPPTFRKPPARRRGATIHDAVDLVADDRPEDQTRSLRPVPAGYLLISGNFWHGPGMATLTHCGAHLVPRPAAKFHADSAREHGGTARAGTRVHARSLVLADSFLLRGFLSRADPVCPLSLPDFDRKEGVDYAVRDLRPTGAQSGA
jgi:hypothetical protein